MASQKTSLLQDIEDGNSSDDSSNILLIGLEEDTAKPGWTKKQIYTAATLSLMITSQTILFGIIAPFFPNEAAKKGATSTEVGLIFGIYELVIFITAPIYGSFIQKIGAKYMLLSGSFILGGCAILFGFLDRCPDGPVYVAMCFICRSVEANGAAMMVTASFAIMASTFPNNVGKAVGTLEIFMGLGMVLGPSIGGALYSVGGFLLPFVTVGGLVWLTTVFSFFTLPKIDDVPKRRGSILSLLKIPGCIVIYLVILGCGISLSFLDPTFSPWMQKTFTWVTIPQIGLVFMTAPGVYGLFAPVSGYISDKGYQGSLAVIGLIGTGVSFFLLGPNPWLATFIPTTLPVTIVALVILGLAIGSTIIPVFPMIIRLARNAGFEDNLETYGLVSGFFESASSLGSFLGPTAAGYLAEKYGFAWSASACGFINVALAVVLLTYMTIMKRYGKWPVPMPEEKVKNEPTVDGVSSTTYGAVNS